MRTGTGRTLSLRWTASANNRHKVGQTSIGITEYCYVSNATTQIPGFNSGNHAAAIAMTNIGIPLTGSIFMGFAVGFMTC